MTVTVTPLDANFGAAITGVDFSGPVDAADLAAVERAFLEHHVVSIRDQHLTPQQTVDLSRRFGPVEPHVLSQYHHPETPLIVVLSNRTEGGKEKGLADAGTFWHSDVSYKERPAKATLLYAIEVPEEGGDTLFCDMMAAYDDLSAAMKERLDGLMALHDYAHRDTVADRQGTKVVLSEANKKETPAVRHPVVRAHPETGRKALYVNPAYTVRIEGMDEAASEELKQQLFDHCLQDKYRMRYKWRAGDALIWDNAAVMHSATTKDLDPAKHRTIWRTIIQGGPTH